MTVARFPRKSTRPAAAVDIEQLNRLIGAIYDGPTESPPWRSALPLLRETLAAKHVTLILRPPATGTTGAMINTDTVRDDATQAYQTHFFALDAFVGLPDDRVVTPEEIVGAAAWRSGALYRDYLAPLDCEYILGADLRTVRGIECRFRITRGRSQPPFADADKALCNLLLPHLKRAIQVHARLDNLECERHLFAGVIERLQLGLITLARDGTVIDTNEEARRILGERDGIQLRGGALLVDHTQDAREFRRLLRAALAPAPEPASPAVIEAMSISRPSGRGRLGVVVRAVPPGSWPPGRGRPAAVVLLRDPQSGGAQASHEIVQRLFGLTPTEAALALNLAEGLALDEAAERLGVTLNTARTYLRFIFRKAGVARQSELIRKLLKSVATLA
jgi:DNA-binding CsgD family transcriptional regulator/PAS domain-containing protein